jgi:hypothetical protein
MFDQIEFGSEFFEGLTAIDTIIVSMAARGVCAFCEGPLYRSDYDRKPRGGDFFAQFGAATSRRFSLCCGSEGCRRRATPPSVRFLGRRVYVGAVVIVASVCALAMQVANLVRKKTGVPPRTVQRWIDWWRGPFSETDVFVDLRSRIPSNTRGELPKSILDVLPGDAHARIKKLLAWLLPLSTATSDASRLMRALM